MGVRIEYISAFGDGSVFDFPTGMITDGNYLFITDRENNKIQVSDFDFALQSEFADSESFLPEDICQLNGHYYVSDSGNNQVLKYDQSLDLVGTFPLSENQPSGIAAGESSLFVVCESQIIEISEDGTELNKFGVYGLGQQNLNYPYSLDWRNSQLYIADSSNKSIKVYTDDGQFVQSKTLTGVGYPAGILFYEGFFFITDANNHKIIVLDDNLTIISEVDLPEMFFPKGIAVGSNFLFVADSGNNQILKYSLEIRDELRYEHSFTNMVKSLYPTGRIFRMPTGSIIAKVHEAINMSFSRLYSKIIGIQDAIFPDNDGFDISVIEQWERVYGIVPRGTIEERYQAIQQLFAYPTNKLARMSAVFIEQQLQNAGFDVYVTYNRFPASATVESNFSVYNFGTVNFGSTNNNPNRFERREPESGYTEFCANYIEPEKDADIFEPKYGTNFGTVNFGTANFSADTQIDRELQLRGTFFLHGDPYPSLADVPEIRKKELRNLILKYKPAQMVCIKYVNYTN